MKTVRHFPDIGSELHNQEHPDTVFEAPNIVWAAISRRLKCVFVDFLEHTKINLRFSRQQNYFEEQQRQKVAIVVFSRIIVEMIVVLVILGHWEYMSVD